MSRHKVGNESGHLTKWIPAGEIDVDPRVQRPFDASWGDYIGHNFNEDLLGVLHVSERTNGRYAVIDGQHRLHGVKNVHGNNGTLLECKVYAGLSRAQESALFVGLNNFKRPRRIDIFLKNVIAKEPHACAINEIAQSVGFRVDISKADHVITAIGSLEEVYFGFVLQKKHRAKSGDVAADKTAKPNLLRDTLSVIKSAWGGTADSVNGHIIGGIGRLLAARQRAMEVPDLVQKLSQYPGGPTALIGTAAGRKQLLGGTKDINLAEVCLELYNKGRRTSKLEALR